MESLDPQADELHREIPATEVIGHKGRYIVGRLGLCLDPEGYPFCEPFEDDAELVAQMTAEYGPDWKLFEDEPVGEHWLATGAVVRSADRIVVESATFRFRLTRTALIGGAAQGAIESPEPGGEPVWLGPDSDTFVAFIWPFSEVTQIQCERTRGMFQRDSVFLMFGGSRSAGRGGLLRIENAVIDVGQAKGTKHMLPFAEALTQAISSATGVDARLTQSFEGKWETNEVRFSA